MSKNFNTVSNEHDFFFVPRKKNVQNAPEYKWKQGTFQYNQNNK